MTQIIWNNFWAIDDVVWFWFWYQCKIILSSVVWTSYFYIGTQYLSSIVSQMSVSLGSPLDTDKQAAVLCVETRQLKAITFPLLSLPNTWRNGQLMATSSMPGTNTDQSKNRCPGQPRRRCCHHSPVLCFPKWGRRTFLYISLSLVTLARI